jgi:hypothetical protein
MAHSDKLAETTAKKFLAHIGMGPEDGYPEDEHEGCCVEIIEETLKEQRKQRDKLWRNALAEAFRLFYSHKDRQLAEPDHPKVAPFARGQICGSGDVLLFMHDRAAEIRRDNA